MGRDWTQHFYAYNHAMKTNKILVALVLLLALALGVSLYYCSQKKQTGSAGEVQPDAENITWSYEDLGTDKAT